MLWGHRNDPVNFHRCLQDFDRRLGDILEALRPGDLLVLTSDHGCDPTTPSTDHSREHALLLAYAAGRNAAGRGARGRVRRRRRDGERLARRQGARPRDPGHADPDAVRIDDPAVVARQYATERAARGAARALPRTPTGRIARELAFEAVAEVAPATRARGRLRPGRARRADRDELGARGRGARRLARGWSSSRARAASTRSVGDVQELPFEDGASTAPSPPGCSTTSPTSTAGSPSSRACSRPGGRLVAVTNAQRPPARAARARSATPRGPVAVHARERRASLLAPHFARVERRDADGWITFPDRARRARLRRLARARRARDRAARRTSCPLRVRRAPRRLRRDEP